jgi:hypothetical protein
LKALEFVASRRDFHPFSLKLGNSRRHRKAIACLHPAMRVDEGGVMHDPQHYCAAVNSACFLIFAAAIFAMVRFPGGGHRVRNLVRGWLKRAFAPVALNA